MFFNNITITNIQKKNATITVPKSGLLVKRSNIEKETAHYQKIVSTSFRILFRKLNNQISGSRNFGRSLGKKSVVKIKDKFQEF